ncbi:MAG: 1-acyl-sn-glycerol-3-phosphate acyltransferase [Prevotella sp.]
MTGIILRIYDTFRQRKTMMWLLLIVVVSLFALQTTTISYKEDISDFLPSDSTYRKSMRVYQQLNAADRIFVFFSLTDTTAVDEERLIEAVDGFAECFAAADTAHLAQNIMHTVDYSQMMELVAYVYDNMPYFLTAADYARMDSLLDTRDIVNRQLEADKQMLMFPTGSMLYDNIRRDPLALFTPVVERLQRQGGVIDYDLYDGHIFSSDHKRAVCIVTSSFGSSETSGNARLVELIDRVSSSTQSEYSDIDIVNIGAPVIAVANADRIKTDSIYTVSFAVILILALLLFTLRNVRNIMLIAVSIAFGWLSALAVVSLFHHDVSVIVMGMSAVIVGIAVNYPLHVLVHLRHAPDVRSTLRELVSPLVIGNVTTVGAFCALIPLHSPALRDLGFFAASMLVGTIVFSMVFLPQMVSTTSKLQTPSYETLELKKSRLDNLYIRLAFILVTLVLGYFSLFTEFDTNMQNINYMTDSQRELFSQLSAARNEKASTARLYVCSEGESIDDALQSNERLMPVIDSMRCCGLVGEVGGVGQFLPSTAEQRLRLRSWNSFVKRHRQMFSQELPAKAADSGFTSDAFSDFQRLVTSSFEVVDPSVLASRLAPITSSYISFDSSANTGRSVLLVSPLTVGHDSLSRLKSEVTPLVSIQGQADGFVFDVDSMNSTIAKSLSSEFNYIGWACGLIVFFFLWLSFGRIELAVIAFLPMAVSWLWILGTMCLLGLKFNLVNVILATFIFGQGDDYSIFITEGLIYERTYRRRLLSSYKRSIFVSAAIMFIGMGVLVFAKHPAMFSIGVVTIVGMASVVLMTCIIPPVVFRWLTVKGDVTPRLQPLTLSQAFITLHAAVVYLSQVLYGVVIGFWHFVLHRKTPERMLRFHTLMYRFFSFDVKHIIGVKSHIDNPRGEDFSKPAIIICNHQSIIDSVCLMALSPRIIIVVNSRVWHNPFVRKVLGYADFICTENGFEPIMERCATLVAQGYSIAVFPEGHRVTKREISRFHKGAFSLALNLGIDIVDVHLHGLRHLMPCGECLCSRGNINITIGDRYSASQITAMGTTAFELRKEFYRLFVTRYEAISHRLEDAAYFAPFVARSYIYKGREVERKVRSEINRLLSASIVSNQTDRVIHVNDSGLGVEAQLVAYLNPRCRVVAHIADADDVALVSSIDNLPPNLIFE